MDGLVVEEIIIEIKVKIIKILRREFGEIRERKGGKMGLKYFGSRSSKFGNWLGMGVRVEVNVEFE